MNNEKMILAFSKNGKHYGAEWVPGNLPCAEDEYIQNKIEYTRKGGLLTGPLVVIDFIKREVKAY